MSYDPKSLVKTAVSQIGVHEVPMGSNTGPTVRIYQSVTGAYGAPWCASFVQWCLTRVGGGPIANRSAGVFYITDYARRRGWLVSRPKPGDLVAFLNGTGHIGIVRTLTKTGYTTVEGNAGNQVESNSYRFGGNVAFIRVPGQVKPKHWVWVPRFNVVTSKKGHAKVVVPWGKWSVVGLKVPTILVKHRAATVHRKVVKVLK